ncbi:NAD(P)/FAD-dependent oxidoreductase [Streptomyces sp. R39]|uniref:NAD(P)/FAD-dependent oxidoreductase n=1 Tax=Streptomyces sp. R39 TaxID=3238631 RepID=A0AB39R3Z7_9ACTN
MTASHDGGLVIVGASLAGLRAAEAARKAGYAGPVTLVGAEDHLPYDRPPLSKQVLDPGEEVPDTTYRTEAYLREDLGVRLRLGAPADDLDPGDRSIGVGGRRIPYDRLIIATGASPRTLPGHEHNPRVRVLRTVTDALAVRSAMDRGDRILVVGCGFIGSEVASALVKRGRPVTLVELAPIPLVRAVGEAAGSYFAELHREHGVDLRLGCRLESVTEGRHGLDVALSDGSRLRTDLVVLGLGAVPATSWARTSGVRLEADGSIAADRFLRTSLPGVYAAGDVVTWENPMFGRRMRLEHWTSAAEQAAVAARNAVANQEPEDYRTVPYFWSDLHGRRIQFVGVHGEDEPLTLADDEGSRVVLHRTGKDLAGALTVARPRLTMRLRKIIAEYGTWTAAAELVLGDGLLQLSPSR